MHKFWVLLRVSLRAMLAAFSFGRSKKRAAGGVSALVFLGFLALYISGIYSFSMAQMLSTVNLLQFLAPLMALLACMMSVMLTVYGASGILFGGRDNDLMLSLPISAFTVMMSRVLALYFENLLFVGLSMLPTAVAHCLSTGGFSAWAVLCFAVIIVFLPLFSTLIGVLLGYVLAIVAAKFSRKALLSNLLYLVFFVGIFAVSFQVNKLPLLLQQNKAAAMSMLHSWLLPFGLILDMLAGSIGAFLLFTVICIFPFLAILYAISTQYKKILTNLTSHRTRNDYHLQAAGIRAQGQFSALLKKEISRYFGTPIYLFNTGFGVLMIAGATVYACIARGTMITAIAMLGGIEAALPMGVLLLCFMLTTICTTCVSISLEGKTLWILKEAPIPAQTLFAAKAGLNFLMAFPVTAVCLVILGVLYGIAVADIVILLLFTFLMTCYVAGSGLFINLLLPKMDCLNDTLVVKQSASAFFGLFGGWIATGLGVLLYMLTAKALDFRGFLLLCCGVLLALCAVLWRYLATRGARRLLAL